jgi:hypothetical protein
LIAALLGAGQMKMLSQGVEQGNAGLNCEDSIRAIDPQRYFNFAGRGKCLLVLDSH